MKLDKLSAAGRQLTAIIVVVVGIIVLALVNKFFQVSSLDLAIIIAGLLLFHAIQGIKEIKLAQIETAARSTPIRNGN